MHNLRKTSENITKLILLTTTYFASFLLGQSDLNIDSCIQQRHWRPKNMTYMTSGWKNDILCACVFFFFSLSTVKNSYSERRHSGRAKSHSEGTLTQNTTSFVATFLYRKITGKKKKNPPQNAHEHKSGVIHIFWKQRQQICTHLSALVAFWFVSKLPTCVLTLGKVVKRKEII